MDFHSFALIICVLNCLNYLETAYAIESQFPTDFKFGAATAAYQIEGAWNEDGKGPSIWDTFVHEHPELIDDRSNGDVAADSYHRFDQDLAIMKELKLDFYRFSISWPRILPNGEISSLNQKGIDYYNMVINKLLENNIEPMVTMYHFDLPVEISKLGGFTNPILIQYFEFYAQTLFEHFGDRVKLWITFNEPNSYCDSGYAQGTIPPRVYAPGIGDYMCKEITLKAHAVAYQLYKRDYKEQGGKIGIGLNTQFYFSKTNDMDVVDQAMQYDLGILGNPLFSEKGNYPQRMLDDISRNSKKEGRAWSRLQPLSDEWINITKGAGDFIALNYYSSRNVEWVDPYGEIPSREHDARVGYSVDPEWKTSVASWLHSVPKGLEGLLKWIRDHYNNVEVMIAENGWGDKGELNDDGRVDYLKGHLQAVLNAVNDGCNVTHYTHWSLIDNFEWSSGYTIRFGLYYVNMNSPDRERIPKSSARFYKKVIETKSIPDPKDY